jgi:DNA replication protein DnaC
MSNPHPGIELRGRRSECESLDRLLEDVRRGQSRMLVLRGEAGVGKTVLLEYLVANASACRIARAAGVESEMELAFAGVHQLCAPLLSLLSEVAEEKRPLVCVVDDGQWLDRASAQSSASCRGGSWRNR